MYKLTEFPEFIDLIEEGTVTSIPTTGDHYLYRRYLAWLAQGNTPEPFETAAERIARLKGEKLAEVNIACRDAIYAGFDCDALGAMHHYPAQDRDQTNLAASVLDSLLPGLPADWTTPFWCVDQAGVWALRPHTAAQIQQVGRVAKAAVIAAIERCAGLEEQIAAATTEAELAAIAW